MATAITEQGLLLRTIEKHPAYPNMQKLTLVTDDNQTTFTCHGCIRSGGAGARYRLLETGGGGGDHHICCAVAPATQPKLAHPEFGDLVFLPVPPASTDGRGRFCGGCGKPVNGFVYHCYGTGLSFHPCCALQSSSCKCAVAVLPSRRPGWSRYRAPAW